MVAPGAGERAGARRASARRAELALSPSGLHVEVAVDWRLRRRWVVDVDAVEAEYHPVALSTAPLPEPSATSGEPLVFFWDEKTGGSAKLCWLAA